QELVEKIGSPRACALRRDSSESNCLSPATEGQRAPQALIRRRLGVKRADLVRPLVSIASFTSPRMERVERCDWLPVRGHAEVFRALGEFLVEGGDGVVIGGWWRRRRWMHRRGRGEGSARA